MSDVGTAAGYARLGALVRQERVRRHQTQGEFAGENYLGVRTLRLIESGLEHNYSTDTLYSIANALGWTYDSPENVCNGLPPVYVVDGDYARIRAAWPRLTTEQRQQIAGLAVSMLARRG